MVGSGLFRNRRICGFSFAGRPAQVADNSGVIDGVGGVMGFIPVIVFMFLAIAFLEDTGYLARVAYMLDRFSDFRPARQLGHGLHHFGGIAGGCAVPGVLATRTLRSPRERLATIVTAPFMNCGAKLPVFAMLIAAFFSAKAAQVMFLLTILSWVAALLIAKLIRLTVLRGPSTPFLLELPPYRLPTFKGLIIHTCERAWQYIRKAGTIILAISIIFWALMSFPGLRMPKRKCMMKSGRPYRLKRHGQRPRCPMRRRNRPEMQPSAFARWNKEAEAALKNSIAGQIGQA